MNQWSFAADGGLAHYGAGSYFGQYGGRYVAETLSAPLDELERAIKLCVGDKSFRHELDQWMEHYVGRPSPLYHARRYSQSIGGAQIFLKREDLNHTGSHKINNTVGQGLLAKHLGKTRIIAETGAGQHGVASATVAAVLGLQCKVFMGARDAQRQRTNVYRMEQLGAEVAEVESGSGTLKDALNEALREWVNCVDSTFYVIGTVVGPRPYPQMVRYFQSIIGFETKAQVAHTCQAMPDAMVACVGGGSNAIGLFSAFLDEPAVKLYGVEAGGRGAGLGDNAAPLNYGRYGVLHGNSTYLLMDEDGQIAQTHSVSAGLDYPGVGPEHSALKDSGRVSFVVASDDEALASFHKLSRLEGIVPALETAHALAYAEKLAATMTGDQNIVVCLSGRGDKDIQTVAALEAASHE